MKSLEARLATLGRKLDDFQLGAAATGEKAKIEFEEWKRGMREKLSELGDRFDRKKKEGGRALEDVSVGLQASFDEIEKAIDQARSRFGA